MSKVIYLLGAGASFGTRNKLLAGPYAYYESGVPVVAELKDALNDFCSTFYPHPIAVEHDFREDIKYPRLYAELTWLRDICKENSSIDNYAKILWSCGRIRELDRLKRAMAMFFSLIQHSEKRDMRYDRLFEAISMQGGNINPSVSILSWNYDRQVEYALHRYDLQRVSDSHQLMYSNITCKNLTTRYLQPDEFNLVKLNGTATFWNRSDRYLLEQGDTTENTFENQLSMDVPTLETGLSFAWEEDDSFIEKILPLTVDTESLVIIGYSMPDVNYKVDSRLIANMRQVKSITIQDKRASELKTSLLDLLSDEQATRYEAGSLKIDFRNAVDTFYIPRCLKA